MTIPRLRFEKIRVIKVLGIEHGDGFLVDAIAPGLTILHGPNGSGKSTLARVALKLLWPADQEVEPTLADERWSGAGDFVIEQGDVASSWHVDVEAGQGRATKDGMPTPLNVGAPFLHGRYRLSLDDLLTSSAVSVGSQDDQFAMEILRQARGGFDLEAAARKSGYIREPSKPDKPRREVRKALQRVKDVQAGQEPFSRLVDQRRVLQQECSNLDADLQEVEALGSALRFVRARRDAADSQSACDSFPPDVRTLSGTERDDLKRLTSKVDEERTRNNACRTEMQAVQARQRALQLTEEERAFNVDMLLAHCAMLERAEGEYAAATAKLEDSRGRLSRATAQLYTPLTDVDGVAAIDVPTLERAQALVGRVNDVALAQQAVDAERHMLLAPQGEPAELPDVDTIRNGIDALAQWLRASAASAVSLPANAFAGPFIVALVFAALSIAAAAAWQRGIAAGAIGAMVVFYVTRASVRRRVAVIDNGPDAAAVYQQRYGTLALPAPIAWSVEAVGASIEHLVRLQQQRIARDEREHRRMVCDERARVLSEQQDRIHDALAAFETDVGVSMRGASPQWLSLFVRNIQDWQQASIEYQGLHAQMERCRGGLDDARRECRDPLLRAGFTDVPEEALTLREVAQRLRDRQSKAQLLGEQETELHARALVEAGALGRAETDFGQFWAGLQLNPGDEQALDLRLAEYRRYREASDEADRAKKEMERAELDLGAGAAFRDCVLQELEEKLAASSQLREARSQKEKELQALQHEIGGLELSHDLAAALANAAHLNEQLRREEVPGIEACVGWAIKEWLQVVTKDRSVAPVLGRATRILTEITAGRLQLRFNPDAGGRASAAFLARNAGEAWRQISALSSGERVQLLLAVRLAFLEEQEQIRLPLVLDEVLGTSDDDRALKIMDAVLRVVASGRQVFYLTAQPDEVAKWNAHLTALGASATIVDLGGVRRLAEQQERPLAPVAAVRTPVPAPEGRSHREYGELLSVSGVNPWEESLDSMHLWHVVEDTELLHRVLSEGIERCGQLRRWRDELAYDGLGAYQQQVTAAELAMRIACQQWRIGRGKSVDAETIAASKAVTAAFKADVLKIVERCKGNGRAIVATLRETPPLRWRRDNTDVLERELTDKGCLPDAESVTRDFARMATLLELQRVDAAAFVSPATLDRIMDALPW